MLRPLHFALVDEVDLLLLDEARTPLIISGPSGDDPGLCADASRIAAGLTPGRHYKVDHRTRRVLVQEPGWSAMERQIGVANLADPEHRDWQHALHNALLAHAVYERDVDYIVDDDHVYLIDEHTGRVSLDKRFSDGLHQALEAKEGVTVRGEDRTLAKSSYQMFFAGYPLLSGMSGTAYSARAEFQRTYGLRVVVVPTHRPMIRRDQPALAFRSAAEKFAAATAEIERLREAGRPVLVGTTSVRESEQLAALLDQRGIDHQVLNAKNHQREAAIIAQAGRPQAVTISTNMAGRGVDIKLGGTPELDPARDDAAAVAAEARRCERDGDRVRAAGGLAVLGTGLHEARRIDDQLRGRAGRQGDPGSSRYFISLDDPVYKRFGEIDPGSRVLERLRRRLRDHPPAAPIRDRSVLGLLEQLRRKVEVENEAARKEVLKYDVVAEQQRRTIYTWRRNLLTAEPAATARELQALPDEIAIDLHHRHFAGETQFDRELYEALADEVAARFDIELDLAGMDDARGWSPERALEMVAAAVRERLAAAAALLGDEDFIELGRQLLLATIDALWTEHLTTIERLDEGIGLRAYGHLDPLVEFRREANLLYQETLREIRLSAAGALCRIERLDADEPLEPATLHPAAARPIRRTLKN
jgi:preprotein translocase subunit SecA